MTTRTFVTPKPNSIYLNLRSEPRMDANNIVGALYDGVRLELVEQISGWYACRVFLSKQVANANDGQYVRLNPGNVSINVRRAPSLDASTKVGEMQAHQKLSYLDQLAEWLMGRVYVSADWCVLITEDPDPVVPVADGFDAPIGTAAERAATTTWPGAWLDANPWGTYYEVTPGRFAYHTGSDLNLPGDADARAAVYAPAAGVVRAAGSYPVWGNLVTIEHKLADGTRVWSRAAHLEDVLVKVNDTVGRGQPIGHVGNAGGTFAYHLHYDIASLDLGAQPSDWPGTDLARVRRDYYDPRAFTQAHRPSRPQPATKLLLGMHDEDGAKWMRQRRIKGVCLVLATVGDQAVPLDFSYLADAGITVLLRIGYGYADGSGTLPRPEQLAAFEKAVADTLNAAKGVTASHYGNEINNPSESPGWDWQAGKPGPNYFALTPEYYLASYNRVWYSIRTDVKLGPAPLDPYFGPWFPYLGYSSDNREWWRALMRGLEGADALFLHSKTQSNLHSEIRSEVKFTDDPLKWQYLHFRSFEPYLAEVPDRFKSLPVYLTEVNPQRKINGGLGWEDSSTLWITECVSYVQQWNAGAGHQAVQGAVFYRWASDEWRLSDRTLLLNRLEGEAQRLGLI